jgi:putative PIN family toxin of toxin-antitoxin system
LATKTPGKETGLMPKRRLRIKAVVDTNVFVGNFLTRSRGSPNRRVIRSWLVERKFKLALSREIEAEYLRIFEELLGFEPEKLIRWQRRFGDKRITQTVGVGISSLSRDPKDNVFIATAIAAKAKFLITNDLDLLDIGDDEKRTLRFDIVKPTQFLRLLESRA